ncbi:MAG: hypothetical protein MUC50_22855 [Myxococcota bacterium]|nr:hypothetical protein [Myxococcota bacterium]
MLNRVLRIGVWLTCAIGWCACEEPRLDVRFDIPAHYQEDVEQIALQVLRPSDDTDASFSCEDLAMGEVPQDVLRASQVQEVRVQRGEAANIADLDREGRKVLFARGITATQETIVAACDEVGDIASDTTVRLAAEPVTVLQANSSSPLRVSVRDVLGTSLGSVEVHWRSVGADGVVFKGMSTSDDEGVAATAAASPKISGPKLLEILARWQREPLVLYSFQWPRTFEEHKCKLFWPGYEKSDPRGTWSYVKLGRIGPSGEIGLAALVDPSRTPSDECPKKLEKCSAACDLDSDSDSDSDCLAACNDDYAVCEAPTLDVRWRRSSGAELLATQTPLGKLGKNTKALNWQLELVPGKSRDRVFLLPLGFGSAWYELDTTGKVLLRHSYTPPLAGLSAQQYSVVRSCGLAEGRASILIGFDGGLFRLYEPEGGQPLAAQPLAKLGEAGGSFGELTVMANGCIGEFDGSGEHLAVLTSAKDGGNQSIVVEIGGELVPFPWSRPLSSFATAVKRGEYEPAALLIGQMGTGNAEVIRVRLQRAENAKDSALVADAVDSLLAMPSFIAAGEIDGRAESGADMDLAAVVSFSNAAQGSADHFAQIVSGHTYKGHRLVGLFNIAQKDSSGLTPHMALIDVSGDGFDDLVVLRRSDQTDPTVHALLSIYPMGE